MNVKQKGGGGKNECTHIRYMKKNVMMELCSERNMPKRAARRTKKNDKELINYLLCTKNQA